MDYSRFIMPKQRGWYGLPAVSSLFFLGGAWAYGSPVSVALNVAMLLLALVSLVRPTVFAWACLMLGSIGYLLEFFSAFTHSWHGPPTLAQWVLFTLIGLCPGVALWWHRPLLAGTDR